VTGGEGGGGIRSEGGTNISVNGCTFTSNSAPYGGGINMENGSVVGCTFSGNTGTGTGGGGISMQNGSVLTSMFYGNTATGGGGGGIDTHGSSTVTNCIFRNNGSVSDNYGGAGLQNSGTAIVTNCTFWNNSAGSGEGGGIRNSQGHLTVTNCIAWDNYSFLGGHQISSNNSPNYSVVYSCVEGGFSGVGNINVDPLFVGTPSNVGYKPVLNVSIRGHLRAPVVGYGWHSASQGNGFDMGAYEYNQFKSSRMSSA